MPVQEQSLEGQKSLTEQEKAAIRFQATELLEQAQQTLKIEKSSERNKALIEAHKRTLQEVSSELSSSIRELAVLSEQISTAKKTYNPGYNDDPTNLEELRKRQSDVLDILTSLENRQKKIHAASNLYEKFIVPEASPDLGTKTVQDIVSEAYRIVALLVADYSSKPIELTDDIYRAKEGHIKALAEQLEKNQERQNPKKQKKENKPTTPQAIAVPIKSDDDRIVEVFKKIERLLGKRDWAIRSKKESKTNFDRSDADDLIKGYDEEIKGLVSQLNDIQKELEAKKELAEDRALAQKVVNDLKDPNFLFSFLSESELELEEEQLPSFDVASSISTNPAETGCKTCEKEELKQPEPIPQHFAATHRGDMTDRAATHHPNAMTLSTATKTSSRPQNGSSGGSHQPSAASVGPAPKQRPNGAGATKTSRL